MRNVYVIRYVTVIIAFVALSRLNHKNLFNKLKPGYEKVFYAATPNNFIFYRSLQ